MRTITLSEVEQDKSLYTEIDKVLKNGGLVCFPGPTGYKLAADLGSPAAVTSMIQAKRRVKNAPSLVFVPDVTWVEKVAADVSADAKKLMKALWPGPLTLLFTASEDLHPKVRKQLTKAKGWLGIRIPQDSIPRTVVRTFGSPLLISSANLAKKHGATSVAQVRKNFGRTVELLIDAGDLATGLQSTLVDLTHDTPTVIREGAVSEEDIRRALAI